MEPSSAVDVLIVGAGPTGLTAANLLGRQGCSTLLVEREPALMAIPRAVSIDDEAMRTLACAGLHDAVAKVVVAGTGTRYYGRDGRLLLYARGPAAPPLGYAIKNPIDQPELEQVLLAGLERLPTVETRFSCTLERLEDRGDVVAAELRGHDGTLTEVRARHVLGCDGGRSSVRELLGVAMRGASFRETWIVVDTIEDPHNERYAMHYGDPRRPRVVIPGRDGRCRYEFLVLPEEEPEAVAAWPFVRRLLAEHRPALREEQMTRCAAYQFHALVAERWRVGRAFLLGDAAHMMPPFAGQGLNSGLRDAFNLCWKLALVCAGSAGERLLDGYERERRPHAESMIRLSRLLGAVMMTTSPGRAALRDAAIRFAWRVPSTRRYLAEMRFRRPARLPSESILGPERAEELVGRILAQADVLLPGHERVHVDDVLGDGFALLAIDAPDAFARLRHPIWARLAPAQVNLVLDDRMPRADEPRLAVADADGRLERLVGPHRGCIVVVRPDRHVAGVVKLEHEWEAGERLAHVLDLPALVGT